MTVTVRYTADFRREVYQGQRCIGSIVRLRGRWQYVARVEDKQLPPAAHDTPETALNYVKAHLAAD